MGKIVPFRTRMPAGWQHRPSRAAAIAYGRRRPRRRKGGIRLRDTIGLALVLVAFIAAGAQTLGLGRYFGNEPGFVSLYTGPDDDAARPGRSSVLDYGQMVSRHFPICTGATRRNCVVDGDTLWIDGEKIRVADINAPEVSSPQCRSEAVLAAQATERLKQLVNEGPFELRRIDRDRDQYGRALRTLHRNGRSLGETLVAEGLAHRWGGRRLSWCV